MKCQDLMRLLNDYIDGDVDPSICTEFEQHVGECSACRVVVDNIKKSITIFKNEQVYEMPIPFRERLHNTLRDKWKQSPPNCDSGEE